MKKSLALSAQYGAVNQNRLHSIFVRMALSPGAQSGISEIVKGSVCSVLIHTIKSSVPSACL